MNYLVQHNVDMNTSLTTPDGFPRADLDVAQSNVSHENIDMAKAADHLE